MKTSLRWTMALAAGILATGGAAPAQAQAPKVAVISAEVKRLPPLDEQGTVVDDIMDASIRELFQRAGFTVEVLPTPADIGYLDDRTLAAIGREAGAQWVVYPKILSLLPEALGTGRLPAGSEGLVLYGRVVDVSNPGRLKTIYMRQVGYPWGTVREAPGVYLAERPGIPTGVAHLFQYLNPLNDMLVARGMPSLRANPAALVENIWTDERVAGFREAFTPNRMRVPVIHGASGRQVGYAYVTGPEDRLTQLRAVIMMRHPEVQGEEPTFVFIPVSSTDYRQPARIPGLSVGRIEGLDVEE